MSKMNYLISVSTNPCSNHVVWNKERLLKKISELFDDSTKNGCTYFDIFINTDADSEHPNTETKED